VLDIVPAGTCTPGSPHDWSDALEDGRIVFFSRSPVPFPEGPDLDFLRTEAPGILKRKNLSYHPEVDRAVGVGGTPSQRERLRAVLRKHSLAVTGFLKAVLPAFSRGWEVATSSFRPFQERGRNLPSHASNERVHVDAGAYGATHGKRILRFFMNANPSEDRVWITKGPFADVYRRLARDAGILPPPDRGHDLREGVAQRTFSGLLQGISRLGIPLARLADSSPYDRIMRRLHNHMKDTPEFQSTPVGHQEFRFPPFSAWMVFTDGVSHACTAGQHAFIDTFIVPLDCLRRPECAPFHVLASPMAC
jgi:hypothetical protein